MDTIRQLTNKVMELTEVVFRLEGEVNAMRQAMEADHGHGHELWTMKDVCQYGHCGRTYVQQLLRQKVFTKARKDGGRWLFDPAQVRGYFNGTRN